MRNKRGETSPMRGRSRGQVTIFIIIAVVIIALVAGYLLLRSSIGVKEIPSNIQPAYNSFLTCFQDDMGTGISVLESRGGYIELPGFEPGSAYMPFSSQLNFAGNPIPYWYYVSGNNIQKEQIPTKGEMEKQLENFIESRIRNCNLRNYYDEGFVISMGEPNADVSIKENSVDVDLSMPLTLEIGNNTASIKNHKISKISMLGKLYNTAKIVYEEEQKNLFLENYGVDVLRLYAPVDGVEITCAPLTWDAEKIFDELQEAIEVNTFALKSKGSEADYFALKLPVDENVRFLNSRNWSNSFEIFPADNRILIATPVGNQQGLGILGFCYVPYHFVYNIRYPVLVQVYNEEEIFQFPVAVVINKNVPRISAGGEVVEQTSSICSNANTDITINTYNLNLEPVQADLKFRCLTEVCNIGKSKIDNESGIASIKVKVPQCVNGIIIANAEGYSEKKYTLSTNEEDSADIVLDKQYKLNLEVYIDGSLTSDLAVLMIEERGENSSNFIDSISYPGIKELKLSEGDYSLSLYVYKNSALTIPETTIRQCAEVPQTGIGGLFGMTEEKCSDITIPSQKINNMLYAGGKLNSYITPDMVENAKSIKIYARSIKLPSTIEEIQTSQEQIEGKAIEIQII